MFSFIDTRIKVALAILLPIIGMIHFGIKLLGIEGQSVGMLVAEIVILLTLPIILAYLMFREMTKRNHMVVNVIEKVKNHDLTVKSIEDPVNGIEGELIKTVNALREQAMVDSVLNYSLSAMSSNIMVTDLDFNIIFANKAILSLFKSVEDTLNSSIDGFDINSVVGTNIEVFYVDSPFPKETLSVYQVCDQNILQLENITFELIVCPVMGENSEKVGYSIEWEDITEHKVTRRQEKRMNVSMDRLYQSVMVADEEGHIIYMNEAANQMFEKAAADIQKELPELNINKLVGQSVNALFRKSGHPTLTLECLHKSVDNIITLGNRSFHIVASHFEDSSHHYGGTVIEWEDITENLEAAKINDRMQLAAKNMAQNIIIADMNNEIIFINNAAKSMFTSVEDTIRAELLSFKVDAIIGQSIVKFLGGDHALKIAIKDLNAPYRTNISINNCYLRLSFSPLIDDNDERIGTILEVENETETHATKVKEFRLRTALDCASSHLLVADENNNIVYMNKKVESMLRDVESELQKDLKGFSVDSIVGSNIDVFHKNPAHQVGLVKDLQRDYKSVINIGGCQFDLCVSPIVDKDNNRLGTVVDLQTATENSKGSYEDVRMKSSLEAVGTNVMIADENNDIVYMNPAVMETLRDAEADIKNDLPHFSVDKIIGSNIDVFHKNPTHQKDMLARLESTYEVEIKIASHLFDLKATPIYGVNNERLGTVVEWQDITARRAMEVTELRLRTSLDCVSSRVMIADDEYRILYINESVKDMLKAAESDIQKDLPNFNIDTLVGQKMDVFHAVPDHQRQMVHSLNETHETEITIGGRVFLLTANAVVNDEGIRLGTVVEWRDRTMEVMVENEVNDVVKAAASGHFTERLAVDNKEGFLLKLSNNINDICEISDKALSEIEKTITYLSKGDLTKRMTGDYQGMYLQISNSLNIMIDNLSELVASIIKKSSNVSSAASEISDGSTDLSERTERQASALEQTAASMEQMNSTVRQNTENAGSANTLAAEAREIAERGGDVAVNAVSAMRNIEESSTKIADIISVIDEIAFQTNLLALNAAVEAARAGDAGKGFAVVASEVRSLAGRSASASKEIKNLIDNSARQVETGAELVNNAGSTLTEIVESVNKVADIMGNIAAASKEQAVGIDEINSSVTSMDDMTQQNAALVEQNTAASRSMQEQAQELREMVRFFNIGDIEEESLLEEVAQVKRVSNSVDVRKTTVVNTQKEVIKTQKTVNTPPKASSGNNNVIYEGDWTEF